MNENEAKSQKFPTEKKSALKDSSLNRKITHQRTETFGDEVMQIRRDSLYQAGLQAGKGVSIAN